MEGMINCTLDYEQYFTALKIAGDRAKEIEVTLADKKQVSFAIPVDLFNKLSETIAKQKSAIVVEKDSYYEMDFEDFPAKAREAFNNYRKKNFHKSKSIKYQLIAVSKAGDVVTLKSVDWETKTQTEIDVEFTTRRAIVRRTYKKHNLQSDIALHY